MDQDSFDALVKRISMESTDAHESVTKLYEITHSTEIRDFDWGLNLYDTLWGYLASLWRKLAQPLLSEEDRSRYQKDELLAWRTFTILSTIPEFDRESAAKSPHLNGDMTKLLLQRFLTASDAANIAVAKQCLHWIYRNRKDYRAQLRLQICTTILKDKGGRGLRGDAGKSRAHVAPLLEIVYNIVSGLTTPLLVLPTQGHGGSGGGAHLNLLQNVLMPLHKPSEMIEWRDQIPVMQEYHQILVRCLVRLVEKSTAAAVTNNPSTATATAAAVDDDGISGTAHGSYSGTAIARHSPPSSSSLLVHALLGLLAVWPQPYEANTPKEVLLLHELETLLQMATPEDFISLCKPILNRLVACIGADTDNFRTMQRAMQILKNNKILKLFGSTTSCISDSGSGRGAATSSVSQHFLLNHSSYNSSTRTSISGSGSSSGDSNPPHCFIDDVMAALLPALYRSGKLSWNPTVNKMTALALLKLRDLDPTRFTAHAERMFGSKHSDGYRSVDYSGGTMGDRRRGSFGKSSNEASGDNIHSDPAAADVHTSSPVYDSYYQGKGQTRSIAGSRGVIEEESKSASLDYKNDRIDDDINRAIKEASSSRSGTRPSGNTHDALSEVYMDVADDKGAAYHTTTTGTKRVRSPQHSNSSADEKLSLGGYGNTSKGGDTLLPPPIGDSKDDHHLAAVYPPYIPGPPHHPTSPTTRVDTVTANSSSSMPPPSSMLPPRHVLGAGNPPTGAHTVAESKHSNYDGSINSGVPSKSVLANTMLGGWKPGSGAAPPVTVTGVAPWAMMNNSTSSSSSSSTAMGAPPSSSSRGSGRGSGSVGGGIPRAVMMPPRSTAIVTQMVTAASVAANRGMMTSMPQPLMRPPTRPATDTTATMCGDGVGPSTASSTSSSAAVKGRMCVDTAAAAAAAGSLEVIAEDKNDEEEAEKDAADRDHKNDSNDTDTGSPSPSSSSFSPSPTGYQLLLDFCERCLPNCTKPSTGSSSSDGSQDNNNGSGSSGDGVSSDWRKLQGAPTPTLLDTLKFHDLVFGRDLGSGAFSVVRYARKIERGKLRDDWPEYAVKVVSAAKMIEQSYHASVIREMAVLQLLSHPGIARLISSFRYTASAYMVLEYAGAGDLHSYVLKRGALRHISVRFIVSEIAAAVASLHDLGFSYGDLKPENVLITEIGHIKIADFGACRAQTVEARSQLASSAGVLSSLRNGDWREAAGVTGTSNNNISTSSSSNADAKNEVLESGPHRGTASLISLKDGTFEVTRAAKADSSESSSSSSAASNLNANSAIDSNDVDLDKLLHGDGRLEGTPAYLPPEVLRGQEVPGFLTDAWALGCVASFCLRGRPLYFGCMEEVLRQVEKDAHEDEDHEDDNEVHGVQFEGTATTSHGTYTHGHSHSSRHTYRRGAHAGGASAASSSSSGLSGGDDGTETDITEESSIEFIVALTHHDPSQRMTVRQALDHSYLTTGGATGKKHDKGEGKEEGSANADAKVVLGSSSSSSGGGGAVAGSKDNEQASDDEDRKRLDPISLHFSAPLPLRSRRRRSSFTGGQEGDEEEEGKGGKDEDQLWARRQFSVLWAPMPTDYDSNASNRGKSSSGADVYYAMDAIEESEVEINSPFAR